MPIYREEGIRFSMPFCVLPPDGRDSLECRNDNIVMPKVVDTFFVLAMKDIDFECVWKGMASASVSVVRTRPSIRNAIILGTRNLQLKLLLPGLYDYIGKLGANSIM